MKPENLAAAEVKHREFMSWSKSYYDIEAKDNPQYWKAARNQYGPPSISAFNLMFHIENTDDITAAFQLMRHMVIKRMTMLHTEMGLLGLDVSNLELPANPDVKESAIKKEKSGFEMATITDMMRGNIK